MSAIRQRFRPKHQILILKCYPKYQKSTVDLKPNSSELSYLLYYASTRRTKLTKVGAFLEKKTAYEMGKGRLGNVQVTLQIVAALIEKCPRDLPLYVSTVLFILEIVLRSHNLNLVEESLPVFTALCTHYDSTTLSADQEHTRQYDGIIQTYASFASKTAPPRLMGKNTSIPESIRYRNVGLQAIKSFISADSFAMDNGKHLRVFMPIILENVHSGKANRLAVLRGRETISEAHEKEQHNRLHRPSLSIPRTTELLEADATVAGGTVADVDQRADEEVGLVALQSLKLIFTANNRSQVRVATNATLGFAISRALPSSQSDHPAGFKRNQPTWATEIFEMICRWTPVQDRFIVLVTTVETLIRSPILEEDIHNQMELTRIIGWLLRSNINFIGLSVMDVLIGLIQHILLLLQLGGRGTGIVPHHQQEIGNSADKNYAHRSAGDVTASVIMEVVSNVSEPRVQLLEQLQHCVGDLATHVYYSDQIGDMVTALLLRLKPSTNSAISSTVAAIENPIGAADAIADSVNMQEKANTDGFFSFDTARLLALRAVTEILVVANSRRKNRDNAIGRHRVDVSTWEGTQWLLRDPNGGVRKAYVEALMTWLNLEVDRTNLNVAGEHSNSVKPRRKDTDTNGSPVAKRALSNASTRSKVQIRAQSFFLQLLHLAVYENALYYAESESDILLLHLLLATLVQKLGVNSVKTGLPMIFRLQDDLQGISNPSARIAIGSLVHGYFWTLSETFEFEDTNLGREIHGEISRRHAQGTWSAGIRVPPLPLETLGTPANASFHPTTNRGLSKRQERLQPFNARHEVVDAIAEGYEQTRLSPPTSPLPSPGRSFSYPAIISNPALMGERTLSSTVKEQMLSEWTKEDCLASFTAHETVKAASVSGLSRHSTRNYLNIQSQQPRTGDPSRNGSFANSFTHSLLNNGALPTTKQAHSSNTNNQQLSPQSSRTPLSASSASRAIVHVADLKRALNGNEIPKMPLLSLGLGIPGHDADIADAESDSMVSISPSIEEGSGSESAISPVSPTTGAATIRGPSIVANTTTVATATTPRHPHFELPTTSTTRQLHGRTSLNQLPEVRTSTHLRRSLDTDRIINNATSSSNGGGGGGSGGVVNKRFSGGSWASHSKYYTASIGGTAGGAPKVDVEKLLNGIDEAGTGKTGISGGRGGGGLGAPPY